MPILVGYQLVQAFDPSHGNENPIRLGEKMHRFFHRLLGILPWTRPWSVFFLNEKNGFRMY